MVRLAVKGIEALYAEYQKRGGKVHPNGPLEEKPWGTKEFGAIDPNGVCVTKSSVRLVVFFVCFPGQALARFSLLQFCRLGSQSFLNFLF